MYVLHAAGAVEKDGCDEGLQDIGRVLRSRCHRVDAVVLRTDRRLTHTNKFEQAIKTWTTSRRYHAHDTKKHSKTDGKNKQTGKQSTLQVVDTKQAWTHVSFHLVVLRTNGTGL